METTMQNRMANFGPQSTTDEVLQGIDLTGKTVLITGGTSGLGQESARALAEHGANVIITGRNMEKADSVAEAIANATGQTVETEQLELGSFASIRAFAGRILQRETPIDLLILNAGVMACPASKTEDGLELQFGSNHIGHFLATCSIVPILAEGGRIVSLSSAGHHFSPIVFDDIQFENREYDRWASYGQSKTANALFAVGLNRRLKARNIEAFSVHPGVIMTELGRHLTEEDVARYEAAVESGELTLKSIPAGAATQVLAATAPELQGQGGSYLADCQICATDDETESWSFVRSYAISPENADNLWSVSEKIVGESFPF